MNIAIANKFFFIKGGQERLIFEEANQLKALGHNVAFFSMKHERNFQNYEYAKYFVDFVELSHVGREYSPIEKIKIAGNFIYNKQAAANFEEFIDDFQPDIIHCHGIAHQISSSILAVAQEYNIPVVQTLHDYQLACPNHNFMISNKLVCNEHKCLNKKYFNCFLNKCVKNSYQASLLSSFEMYFNHFNNNYVHSIEKFITPSKFLYNMMSQNVIKDTKMLYIPNFVDTDKRTPNYSNEGYFLYVGLLTSQKGVLTLIKAFEKLPTAKLLIAGNGPMEDKLKEYQEKNNIKNIEFLGYKSTEELDKLYKSSICVILPSEGYENAPMSILEAFSYGKPVIGSNLGGIPELITQRHNGFVFDCADVNSLKEKILEFIDDKELSSKLGKNARNDVVEKFEKHKHMSELVNLYQSIVKF